MLRKLLLMICISFPACTSNGVESVTSAKLGAVGVLAFDARASDGGKIVLLCSEDPDDTAEQISRAEGVEPQRLGSGENYTFDRPILVDGDWRSRVFLSSTETEPCESVVNSRGPVEARVGGEAKGLPKPPSPALQAAGITLGILVAPIAIVSALGPIDISSP